jgi:hypothetical protein
VNASVIQLSTIALLRTATQSFFYFSFLTTHSP